MKENEPLSKHTSWRIGGPARYYAEPDNPDDVRAAIQWCREQDLPVLMLGSGSNVLVRDSGFPGLVIRYTGRDWHIEGEGETGVLSVQAGAPIAGIARRISGSGWSGLEWAEGLPGTIGGAAFGNAGCYGGDIARVLQRAWLLVDGEVEQWSVEQFEYGYRTSALKQEQHQPQPAQPAEADPLDWHAPPIILAAEIGVWRADPADLAAKMAGIAAERKAKTPWGRSCGSVFKNPPAAPGQPAMSAGQLIDQAGLKGTRIGGAEVSTIHANYMVNLGDATSDDVLRLIELVQQTVQRSFGMTLELEIFIV
jgi:UDP-N-acetylmuramate dehydrogenase